MPKKKKRDPKVGTGKKPKGSGRRLYTDENPRDTVRIKFATPADASATVRKVKNINTNPSPLDPYDFALRASANTWKEFGQPIPKPMYHGIWSASFLRDLKIEGNHLVLMKNLRNFTVQFELLRKTGVPV